MKTKRYFTFIVMIAVLSFGIPAIADLSFYTDRSDWDAAVNGDIVTENFDLVTPYFLIEGVNHAGLIDIEMLNLTEVNRWNSIDNGSDVDDILNIDGTPFYLGGCRLVDPDTIINLHLPSPVWAFGGDFTSTHSSTYGNGLTLQVDGLQYDFEDLLPMNDGTGFLGFISTNAFLTVMLFTPENNETFGLDNVSFVSVPEPATVLLLGLGSSVLLKRGRKQNMN